MSIVGIMDQNQPSSNVEATPQDNTVGAKDTVGSNQVVSQEVKAPEPTPSDKIYSTEKKPEEVKTEPTKEGEEKAEGENKGEEKKEEGESAFELKAPEGIALDPETVAEFTAFAKENKLAPEVAQKVADIGIKHFQKLEAIQAQKTAETIENWKSETRNHPKLGGQNYNSTVETAQKGLQFIQSEEFGGKIEGLNEVLDLGWGNHPAFVDLLHRIGKANSEHSIELGKPSNIPQTHAQAIYGKN